MNNYNQPLSKDEAIDLVVKGRYVIVCHPKFYGSLKTHPIFKWDIDNIYKKGHTLYITRKDYAMYLKGMPNLLEGYGYPNQDIESGIYYGLPFIFCNKDQSNTWLNIEAPYGGLGASVQNWYEVAFKLEDLARVENTLATKDSTKELIDREMPDPAVANVWQGQEPQTIWNKPKAIWEQQKEGRHLRPYNRTLSEVLEEMGEALSYSNEVDWRMVYQAAYNNLKEYIEHATTIQELEAKVSELEADIEDLQSALILQKSKAKVLISHYKDRAKLDRAITKLEEELNG